MVCAAFADALGTEPRLKSLAALGNRTTAVGVYEILKRLPDQPGDFARLLLDVQSGMAGPSRVSGSLAPPGQPFLCGGRVGLNLAVSDDWNLALRVLQARQLELKGERTDLTPLAAAYNGAEVDLLRDAATSTWLSELPQSGLLAVVLQRLPRSGLDGVLPLRAFGLISAMVERKDASDYDRLQWVKVGVWLGCWTVPQASTVLASFESQAARVQACVSLGMNLTPAWGLIDLLSGLSVRDVGEVDEYLGHILFCHPANVTNVYRLKLTRERDRRIFERLALQTAPAQPEPGSGGPQLLVRDVRLDGQRVCMFPMDVLAPATAVASGISASGDGLRGAGLPADPSDEAASAPSEAPAYCSGCLEFVCVRCPTITSGVVELSTADCATLATGWSAVRTCCSTAKCSFESGMVNYMTAEKTTVSCLLSRFASVVSASMPTAIRQRYRSQLRVCVQRPILRSGLSKRCKRDVHALLTFDYLCNYVAMRCEGLAALVRSPSVETPRRETP